MNRTPMEASSSAARNDAVDAMKGLAIIGVILLHAVPLELLQASHAYFHIWQAVPVLVVLMGFTGAVTRVRPLGEYARRRALRLLPAFAAIWAVSLVLTMLWSGDVVWNPLWLVGVLPTKGPGNYFITLILGYTMLLPVIRWVKDQWGEWAMVSCALAANVAFELTFWYFGWDNYLYQSAVVRMLFAVVLGLLIASGWRVWLLLPISVAYLVLVDWGVSIPFIIPQGQSQALFAAGYSSALVMLGLKGSYPAWLRQIGRASYHVFLVQIVWFGQVTPHFRQAGGSLVPWLIGALAVCLGLGLAAWDAEARLMKRFKIA